MLLSDTPRRWSTGAPEVGSLPKRPERFERPDGRR